MDLVRKPARKSAPVPYRLMKQFGKRAQLLANLPRTFAPQFENRRLALRLVLLSAKRV